MALVRNIENTTWQNPSVHDEVARCTYSVFEIDGKKYLQIDTYGSPDRENPGHVTQTLQFDAESINLMRDVFVANCEAPSLMRND